MYVPSRTTHFYDTLENRINLFSFNVELGSIVKETNDSASKKLLIAGANFTTDSDSNCSCRTGDMVG
jgi:hypothetical protein